MHTFLPRAVAGACAALGVASAAAQQQPVGQPPEQRSAAAAVPALVEMRGVLTPRGSWVVEPSLQYAHSTNNRVAIVGFTIIPALTVGLIDVRSVSRDTFIGNLAVRYGITNRLEIEGRLPYVYRHDTTATRPLATPSTADATTQASGHAVGDAEVALRYQLNEGGGSRPYYVAGLRLKTRTGEDPFSIPTDPVSGLQERLPTGSGFLGVQPTLTAIFPSDPAVFFGNVSYLWNVRRSVPGFGNVDPGDAIGFGFGMGLALNDKASFSIGYDHATVTRTTQDGAAVAGSTTTQLGTLLIGVSYRYAPDRTAILSLGAGVTRDAPDVQITLRFPFSF